MHGLSAELPDFSGELNWDSSKPDGTFRKLLDVSKINQLGWKEKISLEEGISMVYERYTGIRFESLSYTLHGVARSKYMI